MRRSAWEERDVGAKARADTLVVMPISMEKMDSINASLNKIATPSNNFEIRRRLFWSTDTSPPNNTLIIFPGEFKKVPGNRNQNQLLLDFLTAQSQRFALGLPDAVLWGSTCAMGQFKVYSSKWNEDHTVSLFIIIYHHR
jgi:hypothetical protein